MVYIPIPPDHPKYNHLLQFHHGLKIMQAGGQMVQLMTTSFVQGIQFLIKEGIMRIQS